MASNNSVMKIKQPINIAWNIPENELKKLRSSHNGYLDSQHIQIPDSGIQYYFRIYPNGYSNWRRGETWIFLYLEFEGKKEIEADFSIFIETANFKQDKKSIYQLPGRSDGVFCPVDELFNPQQLFIVNREMVIKVKGFFITEMKVPMNSCRLGSSGNQICIGLWNHESKDFTIVVDGKEIQVHKAILSIRSPVFSAMFQPHTKEAQEGKFVIRDFSFDVVEAAIKFCYDSSLVDQIPVDDQLSLLQFFDKYDIGSLKDDLEKRLITQIMHSNACRLANCSDFSNAPNLQKKCGEHLQQCVRERKKVSDYDILDKKFVFDLFKHFLS